MVNRFFVVTIPESPAVLHAVKLSTGAIALRTVCGRKYPLDDLDTNRFWESTIPGQRCEDCSARLAIADDEGTRDESWLVVETHVDPEALANPDIYGDFVVNYSDEIARGHQNLVVQSLAEVESFPGVRAATHSDREQLTVWGRVDLKALDSHLRAWWEERLPNDKSAN
jgi:hypothetical protein